MELLITTKYLLLALNTTNAHTTPAQFKNFLDLELLYCVVYPY